MLPSMSIEEAIRIIVENLSELGADEVARIYELVVGDEVEIVEML